MAASFVLAGVMGCHRGRSSESEGSAFRIPRDAARFSILSTTDSTVVFRALEAKWLRVGMRGHAVDPTQRDALIARLTIQRMDTSGVFAVINGRVSQVSTTHVVLMVKPTLPWWKDLRFWYGAGAGVATGALIGLSSK